LASATGSILLSSLIMSLDCSSVGFSEKKKPHPLMEIKAKIESGTIRKEYDVRILFMPAPLPPGIPVGVKTPFARDNC